MASPSKAADAVQPEYSLLTRAQAGTTYKVGKYLCPVLLLLSDYLSVVAALLTAWHLRSVLPTYFSQLPPLDVGSIYIYYVIPLSYIAFLTYDGMYVKRLQFWQSTERVFRICFYATGLLIGLLYFLGKAEYVSRGFVLIGWIFSFLYIITARYGMKKIMMALGLWQKPVVIVGAGKTAEILAKTFIEEPGMGYEIVGLIEDNYRDRALIRHYPHLGTFLHAEQAIAASGVQDVIIATPGIEREELIDLVYRIQPLVKRLTIVPNLFGVPLSNMEVETLFYEKVILLHMRNNLARTYNRVLKRIFDLTCSILGGVLISPVLLVIAIAIYIESPGPVFFSHMRVGANGKYFPCYKFRSMVTNSQEALKNYLETNSEAREEWNRDFKLKDDPRVTRIGRFLRKTSLDELPQLLNVIKGEMSLVGPRPIIDQEIPKYGEYINDYYLVRPGMTGYWQVSGRNDIDYNSRVQMDSWYVRNWSVWLDIVFIVKTVAVVVGRKGAY